MMRAVYCNMGVWIRGCRGKDVGTLGVLSRFDGDGRSSRASLQRVTRLAGVTEGYTWLDADVLFVLRGAAVVCGLAWVGGLCGLVVGLVLSLAGLRLGGRKGEA